VSYFHVTIFAMRKNELSTQVDLSLIALLLSFTLQNGALLLFLQKHYFQFVIQIFSLTLNNQLIII